MFRLKNSSDARRKDRACWAPGWLALQKALDPATEKAVEVQEDLRQGRYDGEQESGDPPEAGDDSDEKGINGEPDA